MKNNSEACDKKIKSIIHYFKKEHLKLMVNLSKTENNQLKKSQATYPTGHVKTVPFWKENSCNLLRYRDYLRYRKMIFVKSLRGKTISNNIKLPNLKSLSRIKKYKMQKINSAMLTVAKKIQRKYKINRHKKIRIYKR